MMRFSLKWILVAVVYVAIAAAAFSQQSWVYADVLWAASLLAIVFAALLAFMGRGKGRVAAAGFLLAGLAYVACVAFGQVSGGDVVPTTRWLIAAGYDEDGYSPVTANGVFGLPAPGTIPPPAVFVDFAIYVRAANAVSMMLFGTMGALVGLFAFKRISQSKPETN